MITYGLIPTCSCDLCGEKATIGEPVKGTSEELITYLSNQYLRDIVEKIKWICILRNNKKLIVCPVCCIDIKFDLDRI